MVTVSYFIVYYAFMVQQIMGKGDQWSKHNHELEYHKMTDRTFLNALEQMGPFLIPLWTHALLVDPEVSGYMGWVAVAARLLFPVLWSLDGHWNWKVELSTQPYYCVLMYFLFSLACKAIWNINLYEEVASYVFPFVVLGGFALMFLISGLLGFLLAKLNRIHFTEEQEPLQ